MLKASCLTAIILFAGQPAIANEFWDNWEFAVAAGYGERSNPLLNADDIKTYINVDIAWYGDRFFFDNGDIGYNLYFGENFSVNLIGQLNNERAFFGETNIGIISFDTLGPGLSAGDGLEPPDGGDPTNGEEPIETPDPIEYEVADRNHAYEAGVEVIYEDDWGQLQISLLNDISSQHSGQRADVVFSTNHIHQRWLVRPSLGLSWKSSSLTDYYFGVEPDESNQFVNEYTADASLNAFASVLLNYAIKKDLFWGLKLGYEQFGDEIADSPIVVEDDVFTAYTGLKYRF